MRRAQRPHARQQPARGHGGRGRQRDGTALGRRTQARHGLGHGSERIAQHRLQLAALRRQHELARLAHEQRHAQRLLELAHLVADGGGRDRQLVRRELGAAMACGGLEGAQRGQRRQGMQEGHGVK
ncbi:hypothetical protein FQZ97_1116660 [compost metagenome]